MKHPPITRHQSLQPFSRDHYAGLVQVQHMRRAAGGDAAVRIASLREFAQEWKQIIAEHFADEERLLLPLINNTALATRLREEHAALRTLARQAIGMHDANAAPDPAWLRTLADQLHDHIRWEERELFPSIESDADSMALDRLEQETVILEQSRPRWQERRRP